jgi:hypothetical protein
VQTAIRKEHRLSYSPNINAVMKSRSVILVRHVERFGKMTNLYKNLIIRHSHGRFFCS